MTPHPPPKKVNFFLITKYLLLLKGRGTAFWEGVCWDATGLGGRGCTVVACGSPPAPPPWVSRGPHGKSGSERRRRAGRRQWRGGDGTHCLFGGGFEASPTPNPRDAPGSKRSLEEEEEGRG